MDFAQLTREMNSSESIIRRYLFGELSEDEQAALEERYFTDQQVFDQVVEAENKLVDDYARGRLTPQSHQKFEQYYLTHPSRKERSKLAQALVTKLDHAEEDHWAADFPVKTVPWWRRVLQPVPATNRALAFSVSLALLLLMLGAVWLLLQTRRLREDLVQNQSARGAQEQRERDMQQQLADERNRTKDLSDELARLRSQVRESPPEGPANPATRTIATLLLTALGTRRAEMRPAPTLTIPTGTEQVRIQLSVRGSDYPKYNAVLQAIGGEAVFSRDGLKPKITKSGATFVLMAPARDFATGDYILTLRGVGVDGEVDDVSKSIFRVKKL